jgi:hypothetical protein
MKVLLVGVIEKYMCNDPKEFFPKDVEYTTLDADPDVKADVYHDIRWKMPDRLIGQFDAVFCSHVLEHIEWKFAQGTVEHLGSCLKPGGQLHLFVPDIEWACKKILEHDENMSVIGTLYGGQSTAWDYHKCGYTERSLQQLVRMCGLEVVKVLKGKYRGIYHNTSGVTKDSLVDQVYVIGRQPSGPFDG